MKLLNNDTSRCTGITSNNIHCVMKNNCLRHITYQHDTIRGRETNEIIYTSVLPAPNCIEKTKLNCPLKIEPNN